MHSRRTTRALTILFVLFASACSVLQTGAPPTSLPATATRVQPHTTPTPSPSYTPAPIVTATPSPEATDTPTAAPAPTSSKFVLLEERQIGSYTVRLWQPVPGTGMYNHATIHAKGQPEIRVEAVTAIHHLPADVTGDGQPDVWFETYAGGSHCCSGTVVYNLGPAPTKVLEISEEPGYYGTGSGTFQDLDGDSSLEFMTRDPLKGIPCSGPTVKVILQYVPGRGYVSASPRFASAYTDDIAAHTRRAEEEIELSRDGYKCGVYEVIVDYLYSGQVERAWTELQRLYLGSDLAQFRVQLEQAVSAGRFFAPAPAGGAPAWKLYTDGEAGFTFEYPQSYDEEPMRSWGCSVFRQILEGGGSQVVFGLENHLRLVPAGGLSLNDYADQLMQQLPTGQYARRDDARLSQHDPPGIVIETTVMHHGVIYALYQRTDTIYFFSAWLSLACSAPEQGITNPGPFWHAVESFRFTR